MENLEISGKTVEQAIRKALEQLGVSREEIEVTILSEGRPGILGLGAEEARIRVTLLVPLAAEEDKATEIAKEVLETLLETMRVSAEVVLQPAAREKGEVGAPSIVLNIRGDDLGILIGRRGQTLACLQYIVRLIVSQKTQAWLPIVIDVEGYRQRRDDSLRALALRIAEQVKLRGKPFSLEPMPAYERRIIHLALANHQDVATQSIGEGETRKVVIRPKNK